MSYRISKTIVGSLTLTSCGFTTSEQWQGREIQQVICLDEPASDDYYCQNTDTVYTTLPWVQYFENEVITQQYFLDITSGIGTIMIQQELMFNNKQYSSSYFIRSKANIQADKITIDFGYQSLECQKSEDSLKCSWYNDVVITFEIADSDMMIFND